MILRNWRIVYYILYTLMLVVHGNKQTTPALPGPARLRRHLLNTSRYDKHTLPANKTTNRVQLTISVNVFRINDIDDREQEFSFVGNIEVGWNNPFLRWEPSKWGGIKSLLLKEDDLWLPDICVLERLDKHVCLPKPERLIYLNYKGQTDWKLGGGVIKVACPLDVRKFPFDEQACSMSVGSYIMTTNDLQIINKNNSRVIESMGTHSLWAVTGFSSKMIGFDQEFVFGKLRWEYLVFTVNLRRKPTYFITNIIAPCMVISFLMCGVFYLPPSGGEKIGFSITLLLAFNVIQLVILDTMPQTSESTPVISSYISALLILAGLCIPASIFVIHIHHSGYEKFPRFMRKTCFKFCFWENKVEGNESHEIHDWAPGEWNIPTEVTNGAAEKSRTGNGSGSEIQTEVLKEITRKRETESKEEKWERAAKKMDRFFLKLFFGTLILVNLVCGLVVIFI